MSVTTHDDDVFDRARRVLGSLMEQAGMRQEDLAPELGLAQTTLSDRLRGRSKMTIAEVHRAAQLFEVPAQAFFEEPQVPRQRRRMPSRHPAWVTAVDLDVAA